MQGLLLPPLRTGGVAVLPPNDPVLSSTYKTYRGTVGNAQDSSFLTMPIAIRTAEKEQLKTANQLTLKVSHAFYFSTEPHMA